VILPDYLPDLDLIVGHTKTELLHPTLDSIPACQSRGEMNVTSQAKISRIDDFVSAWVIQNSLGMNTRFVGKGAETGDWIVERYVNLHSLSDHIFDLSKRSAGKDTSSGL
jgi:hypothetical protein